MSKKMDLGTRAFNCDPMKRCNLRNKAKVKIGKKTIRVDLCLAPVLREINSRIPMTLAFCCGHNVYHPTIFMYKNEKGMIVEYFTELEIKPIKRKYWNFYQKDKNGFYFNKQVEDYYQEKWEKEGAE